MAFWQERTDEVDDGLPEVPSSSQSDPFATAENEDGPQAYSVVSIDRVDDPRYVPGQDPSSLPLGLRAPGPRGDPASRSPARFQRPSAALYGSRMPTPHGLHVPTGTTQDTPVRDLTSEQNEERSLLLHPSAMDPPGPHATRYPQAQSRFPAELARQSNAPATPDKPSTSTPQAQSKLTALHRLNNLLGRLRKSAEWAYNYDTVRGLENAWRATVIVDGVKYGSGDGPSKAAASQVAAARALPWLMTRQQPETPGTMG